MHLSVILFTGGGCLVPVGCLVPGGSLVWGGAWSRGPGLGGTGPGGSGPGRLPGGDTHTPPPGRLLLWAAGMHSCHFYILFCLHRLSKIMGNYQRFGTHFSQIVEDCMSDCKRLRPSRSHSRNSFSLFISLTSKCQVSVERMVLDLESEAMKGLGSIPTGGNICRTIKQ